MAHHVDIFVGNKIRQLRKDVGMTQQQLGREIGIKFQQVQKYESGANRVSASRLWQLSKVLNVEVSSFFDGLLPSHALMRDVERSQTSEIKGIELVSMFEKMPDEHQKAIMELARELTARQ